ncbi:thioredoxin-like protein [Backusella circina FSU 941]|nr:thioredoxin-like protein [Backusella circina FSU 941]
MLFFQFALLLITGYISLSVAEPFELTPSNVDDTVSNGIWYISYFSLSCPHSEAFAPVWRQLAKDYEAVTTEREFHFGTIDCTNFGDLCTKHRVDASPTLQMFENGEFKELYSGPKKYNEVINFINKKISLSATLEESSTIDIFEFDQDRMSDDLADKETAYKELPNPRGVSISLDGNGLNQIIKSKEYWFVKFYSPSCPHCIALGPTWSQMASELRNQVNVAEVNCEALPSVCRQNSIPYVPLLRLYGGRSPLEYHGDRSLKSLVHFAKSNSRPFAREINSNSFDFHSVGKDTALFYLYSDDEVILVSESVKTVAKSFTSNIPFYTSNDQKIIEKFDIKLSELPALLIIRDGIHKVYPHKLENSLDIQENLAKWIAREQNPLVYQIDVSNSDMITGVDRKLVIHLISEENRVNQNKFYEIASQWFNLAVSDKNKEETDVAFAEIELSQWRRFLQPKSEIMKESTSQIIILDTLKSEYYTTDQNHQLFAMDDPENIYNSLKSLNSLTGRQIGLIDESTTTSLKNEYSIFSLHGLFFMFVLTTAAFIVQKNYTFYTAKFSKTNELLPSYQAIGSNSHKH